MIAFHGKPETKALYLTRILAHRQADELVRGVYYDTSGPKRRMCAVGCTVHSDQHGAYERELGIPIALAYLEDRIFEGLSRPKAMAWPERFLRAIPVGADLSGVVDRLLLWLLATDGYNVAQYTAHAGAKKVIALVHTLYARRVAGDLPTDQEWKVAAAAAAAVCVTTVSAHADAYTASTACTAAIHATYSYSDANAAAVCASAARAADASSDANYDAIAAAPYARIADQLIALLEAAPVPHVDLLRVQAVAP